MAIIGLLLIALVCLAIGLLLTSSWWMLGSLIASGIAGWLLYTRKDILPARREPARADERADQTKAASAPTATDDPDVWVVDGRPRFHQRECEIIANEERVEAIPLSQALEDGFMACTLCEPTHARSKAS